MHPLPLPILAGITLRAAFLWTGARALVAGGAALARASGIDASLVAIPAWGAVLVVAAVTGLSVLDARLMRQELFLANLGIGARVTAASTAALAAALEAGVALAATP